MALVKSESELEGLRVSGRIAAMIRDRLAASVAPGVTTGELGDYASELMTANGAESAFLGYRGYPGLICVSVNDEVVHGIPGERLIAFGDIVSIDVGIRYRGFIGDTATTVMVGVSDPDVLRLVSATKRALDAGIAACRSGVRVGAISHAIERTVLDDGCAVVRDFVGHGVGRRLHEEPQVPNFGRPGKGPVLKPGMTLAIEPMINQGGFHVETQPNGWTVRTRDRKRSAHCEHTVLVVPTGPAEVLTCADRK